MTKSPVKSPDINLLKNQIVQILEQLTIDCQNSQAERKILANFDLSSEDEFTLLEEIELLTTDLRGYANQIKVNGTINQKNKAIKILGNMEIFPKPIITRFYFNNYNNYPQVKAYLQLLDYLRLLMLDYAKKI